MNDPTEVVGSIEIVTKNGSSFYTNAFASISEAKAAVKL